VGCYDTVVFTCPRCYNQLEFQSKGGPCGLYVYTGEVKVPTDVAAGLDTTPVHCVCGQGYVVKVKKSVRVKLVAVGR
jgi:hypothetical protein